MTTASPLYTRAAGRITEIARRVVACLPQEVPFYELLPEEVLAGEVTEFTTQHLRIWIRALMEDRLPSDEELAGPLEAIGRRAQEGVPLAAILAVFPIGTRVVWEAVQEMARPGEEEAVLAVGGFALRYLEAVMPAVATMYLEVRHDILSEERETRRLLVSALLTEGAASSQTAELAQRAGIALAPAYVLVHLRLPALPHLARPGAQAAMAIRRRERQTQEVLDEYAKGSVLTSLEPTGGVALLPTQPETAGALLAELPSLIEQLAKTVGGPVTAGAAAAGTLSLLPQAAVEARDVAGLAASLGRPPGLYVIDDLLLEFQLSRPGAARDRLVARLDPLSDQPHLLDALRAYLALDHNRRAAAAQLHVHPNTLDYRLRRVTELIGLDPSRPTHSRLLSAALMARELSVPSQLSTLE